jgi:2,4-dienoyl-CoA reductase-like NADH-dependent reductase (Old Yellow Enzyme family)
MATPVDSVTQEGLVSMRNVRAMKTTDDFRAYLDSLGLKLPLADEMRSGSSSPLAQSLEVQGRTVGNRWAILPMEGWDNTTDGKPTDLTRRRWQRWGESGAKLIFGAEAMAVRPDGRGSPVQLMMIEPNLGEIRDLRALLVQAHEKRFSRTDDLLVGVQLTHSGRVAHPNSWEKAEPRILYHHPILDARYDADGDEAIMTDDEIEGLVQDFVTAARLAHEAGFDFVDVKHCHGYLGHEFLSAVDRPGRYGGSFENRTRFLREIVSGIRSAVPDLEIAVRFSAVDFLPFVDGPDDRTRPVEYSRDYPYAFGGDGTGTGTDLSEPLALLDLLERLDIKLVCVSAGAEYNSHIMEPYSTLPVTPRKSPEDPLVGVARLVTLVADLKRQRPGLVYVGSGYSYLQHWLPNVAQAAVEEGWADFIGIGRMSFSYPDLCADVLEGRPLQRKRICTTCGYCDVAPTFGVGSGCYALDEFYRRRPEFQTLKQRIKEA